ncbi:hypothetical protein CIHG_02819 [Coccidioides immitis H538.4]|uniref:Uncharacterized protein n=1 Tax=Coccidioides immitis H538.4 TaxID=396776 RepID=A0A0J8RK62_COCIT|nr:hypothetical protein CIHG_02819 [Coccidioides immitis H538.4]
MSGHCGRYWMTFSPRCANSIAEQWVTARERASIIKKAQEDALARLPLNTLFIVLYIRSDPPQSNDFHWGYYFHTSAQGGLKYHMRNLGGGWIPDHGPTGGVFQVQFPVRPYPDRKRPTRKARFSRADYEISRWRRQFNSRYNLPSMANGHLARVDSTRDSTLQQY